MSKEIPFSVKKTKSIFNSAMQEMEVYVENIRKKFGVFNYAPFRTPYTPDNQFQMLLDPANPGAGSVKPVVQQAVVWNPTTKFQTSSQKWHMQKVHRQQQGQTQPATQAQVLTQVQRSQQPQQQAQVSSSSSGQQPSSSTRYQTRQARETVSATPMLSLRRTRKRIPF